MKSGLLTSYITLKYTEGRYVKFSKIGFLLSRFIRLTPQLAIFMLLTTLIPVLGSGPVWDKKMQPIINNCHKNWWKNLIYLQTFFGVHNTVIVMKFC
jgi:peptidoglycan/LPS O-acetylase OafA/YrhL